MRTAKFALALSITALVLGPAAGFGAGYMFAKEGEQGPRGYTGKEGPPGPVGPVGPPGLSSPDLSGALVSITTARGMRDHHETVAQ